MELPMAGNSKGEPRSKGPRPPALAACRLILATRPSQLGWLLFGFGMIFVWTFGLKADYGDLLPGAGPPATAPGVVTRTEEGYGTINESEIFATHYTFVAVDGHPHAGVSYTTGRRPAPGERVTVEFPPGDPARSRIAGMRRAPFPAEAGLCSLFALIGIGLASLGYVRGRRAVKLLRSGQRAPAILVAKAPARQREGDEVVYELTYRFTADGGRDGFLRHRTHEPARLEGETPPWVLYDPRDPGRALLADALPGRPWVDEAGALHFEEPPSLWGHLILPVVGVVGHGGYACLLLAGLV